MSLERVVYQINENKLEVFRNLGYALMAPEMKHINRNITRKLKSIRDELTTIQGVNTSFIYAKHSSGISIVIIIVFFLTIFGLGVCIKKKMVHDRAAKNLIDMNKIGKIEENPEKDT